MPMPLKNCTVNEMKNQSGKNDPNERIVNLWFMRLTLSQYKFKNCSQKVNIYNSGIKIVVFWKLIPGDGGKVLKNQWPLCGVCVKIDHICREERV